MAHAPSTGPVVKAPAQPAGGRGPLGPRRPSRPHPGAPPSPGSPALPSPLTSRVPFSQKRLVFKRSCLSAPESVWGAGKTSFPPEVKYSLLCCPAPSHTRLGSAAQAALQPGWRGRRCVAILLNVVGLSSIPRFCLGPSLVT